MLSFLVNPVGKMLIGRKIIRWAAGRRLQGVTETYNINSYNPFCPPPDQLTSLMTREEYGSKDDGYMRREGSDQRIVAALERATRKYGCYMLEVDELEFKNSSIKMKPSDEAPGVYSWSDMYRGRVPEGGQADPKWSQKMSGQREEVEAEEETITTSTMRLDARKGSIILRHTNMYVILPRCSQL